MHLLVRLETFQNKGSLKKKKKKITRTNKYEETKLLIRKISMALSFKNQFKNKNQKRENTSFVFFFSLSVGLATYR